MSNTEPAEQADWKRVVPGVSVPAIVEIRERLRSILSRPVFEPLLAMEAANQRGPDSARSGVLIAPPPPVPVYEVLSKQGMDLS